MGSKEILGITRDDYTGYIQKFRDKKNISYTLKDGREIFAKFAKFQEGNRNNLEGLNQEAEILKRLESTGVTPKFIQLKQYPNEKMARLVTEKVGGISLDRFKVPEKNRDEIFENVIISTARSLQKIHDEGVYVVDINTGTFLVNESGEDCNIVDFELAIDSSNPSEEKIKNALKFRSVRESDFGYKTENNIEHIQKKEIYIWAETMLDFIAQKTGNFDLIHMDLDLSELPEDIRIKIQSEIETVTQTALPIIQDKVESAFLNPDNIQKLQERFDRYRSMDRNTNFEQFIQEQKEKEINTALKRVIDRAVIKLTLKFKLEKIGVKIPEKIVSFLERSLDLNPNNRPTSFNDIL